ncbi:MAG: putative ABC transporter permease [Candidatus Colwellbacteria bacterium]|nr:putative ABC transporter permease [Candidatus Colwellbacteria bacterium]
MIEGILINYLVGMAGGFFLELVYRSVYCRRFVRPLFINANMYGLAAVGLFIAYFFKFSSIPLVLFATAITMLIEYVTGTLYLRLKGKYLWDYSKEPMNYKGIISPRFVIAWVLLSLMYFYLIIPKVDGLRESLLPHYF